MLNKLPPSTKFKGYDKKPGDSRVAYYSPKQNTIYIPNEYSSEEAAPTAAHEATHAYQCAKEGRPKSPQDKIEMEVEAKNVGLDVYGEMGKKGPPSYKKEAEFRAKDPDGYEKAVRFHYKKRYGVK